MSYAPLCSEADMIHILHRFCFSADNISRIRLLSSEHSSFLNHVLFCSNTDNISRVRLICSRT